MVNGGAADVLVISSLHDIVACRLRSALEERHCKVLQLDGSAAARLFTLRLDQCISSVAPSVAMFIRPSAWQPNLTERNADERFLHAEAYATIWAAATLCKEPVINRPSINGYVARLTWGAINAAANDAAHSATELYTSGPEMLDSVDDALWGEDMSFHAAPVALLRSGMPLRARRVNPAALYEIVTVVGGSAFPATSDSRTKELNLPDRSLQIAKQAQVHFATITWAVDDNGAVPTRLNAAPDEAELRHAWTEVADALCEDLVT
jgi:hypothetical protein